MELKELTYKELHDLLGKSMKVDKELANKEAIICIGNKSSCTLSTVKGLLILNASDGNNHTMIQGAWKNGNPIK